MPSINLWAVLAAALATFALGGLWYAPFAFGKSWQRAAKLTDEQLAARNPKAMFGLSFIYALIAALVFAVFLGPSPSLPLGLGAGVSAGLCWVTTSFGINYLFEARGLKLLLINGGYHTLQFTIYGLILGVWH